MLQKAHQTWHQSRIAGKNPSELSVNLGNASFTSIFEKKTRQNVWSKKSTFFFDVFSRMFHHLERLLFSASGGIHRAAELGDLPALRGFLRDPEKVHERSNGQGLRKLLNCDSGGGVGGKVPEEIHRNPRF